MLNLYIYIYIYIFFLSQAGLVGPACWPYQGVDAVCQHLNTAAGVLAMCFFYNVNKRRLVFVNTILKTSVDRVWVDALIIPKPQNPKPQGPSQIAFLVHRIKKTHSV